MLHFVLFDFFLNVLLFIWNIPFATELWAVGKRIMSTHCINSFSCFWVIFISNDCSSSSIVEHETLDISKFFKFLFDLRWLSIFKTFCKNFSIIVVLFNFSLPRNIWFISSLICWLIWLLVLVFININRKNASSECFVS